MIEILCRVRDFIGLGLVVVGFNVMTDDCVVEVVKECALAVDENDGGAERPEAPAIRPTPRGV